MKFILGLLLFIIIFRLVSRLAFKWLNRKFQNATHSEESFPGESATKADKKKVIGKDKGDYVDFEEME